MSRARILMRALVLTDGLDRMHRGAGFSTSPRNRFVQQFVSFALIASVVKPGARISAMRHPSRLFSCGFFSGAPRAAAKRRDLLLSTPRKPRGGLFPVPAPPHVCARRSRQAQDPRSL